MLAHTRALIQSKYFANFCLCWLKRGLLHACLVCLKKTCRAAAWVACHLMEKKEEGKRTLMLLMLISELWLTIVSMMPASSCDITFLQQTHANYRVSTVTAEPAALHSLQLPARPMQGQKPRLSNIKQRVTKRYAAHQARRQRTVC